MIVASRSLHRGGHPFAGAALACALAAASAGCAAGYGFGVGVRSDTNGEVAAVLSAQGSFGIAFEDDQGLMETIRADVAPPGLGAASAAPVVGIDLLEEFEDLGFRIGLRGMFDFRFAEDVAFYIGAGGSVAILGTLDTSRWSSGDYDAYGSTGEEYEHLGVQLEGYWAADGENDAAEPFGVFSASLVYEWYSLDDDPLEDLWN